MQDHELRALVRDAVARHLGAGQTSDVRPPVVHSSAGGGHASHAVYLTLVNVDDACVIEPAVPCTHCQYCKSHGH